MSNRLIEYAATKELNKYIDGYWSFRNNSGDKIYFPVVPDGCSDIIFYLNNSLQLGELKDTFITGVMEQAQLIPIPDQMELFGIRFKPAILSYLLDVDFGDITNNMIELNAINKSMNLKILINPFAEDSEILATIENQLLELCKHIEFSDNILEVCNELRENPQISIIELAEKYNYSQKSLQRSFYKRVGIPPKRFARIMRFQKAHKQISKEGLKQLIFIALDSGYFDQAHFNREYKKLAGTNPSSETMSILYNT